MSNDHLDSVAGVKILVISGDFTEGVVGSIMPNSTVALTQLMLYPAGVIP